MEREIKLIVTDMDGTMFTTEKTITPRAMRAIREARSRGVEFTVATGRNRAAIDTILERLDITAPVIVGNGAFIQDARQFYHREVMSDEDILSVMEVTRELGCSFFAFDADRVYCERTPASRHAAAIWLSGIVTPGLAESFCWFDTSAEVFKAVRGRTAKLLVIEHDLKKNRRIRTAIEQRCNVMIVNAEPANLDISNPGVSKGKAILELGRILGIDREQIMALGDAENDKEMMEYAGLGVAMANAVEETKAAADFVTLDNDHDGFAYAIEKFVLGEG